MVPVPVIILTTPEQELHNLTELLDCVPAGETLPLRGQGEALPLLRPRISKPSTALPEVLDSHLSVSGNVTKSTQILKRTKGSDSLSDVFISSKLSEHQQIKHSKAVVDPQKPLTSIMAYIVDISSSVTAFSNPFCSLLSFSSRLNNCYTWTDSQPRRPSQVSFSKLANSSARDDHQTYPLRHSPACNKLKTWEVVYTPSKLKQQQDSSITTLQPVSIHKKKGILSATTILEVSNELNQSAIQPDGFCLGIPKYHEQIEVQFRLLMIRNAWDTWPMCYQQDMHAWPLAKKWLLIYQYEALVWVRNQCTIAGSPKCKADVLPIVSSGNTHPKSSSVPTSTSETVSAKPVKTAYHYILRDWHKRFNMKSI